MSRIKCDGSMPNSVGAGKGVVVDGWVVGRRQGGLGLNQLTNKTGTKKPPHPACDNLHASNRCMRRTKQVLVAVDLNRKVVVSLRVEPHQQAVQFVCPAGGTAAASVGGKSDL